MLKIMPASHKIGTHAKTKWKDRVRGWHNRLDVIKQLEKKRLEKKLYERIRKEFLYLQMRAQITVERLKLELPEGELQLRELARIFYELGFSKKEVMTTEEEAYRLKIFEQALNSNPPSQADKKELARLAAAWADAEGKIGSKNQRTPVQQNYLLSNAFDIISKWAPEETDSYHTDELRKSIELLRKISTKQPLTEEEIEKIICIKMGRGYNDFWTDKECKKFRALRKKFK